jgi:hypothetical protein
MVAAKPLANIIQLFDAATGELDIVTRYTLRYTRRRRFWSARLDSAAEFRKQWGEYIAARVELGLHPMINPPAPLTPEQELAADRDYEDWLESLELRWHDEEDNRLLRR